MKANNLKITFTLFTVLLTIGVFAQGPPGGGQGGGRGQEEKGKPDASEILSKLDTNKDDLIDIDEAAADKRGKIAEHFDEIDTNSDTFIDLEELKDALNDRKKPKKIDPEKLIQQIDDDGNGKLNELEVAAKGKKELSNNFTEIDTNEDAELDVDELKFFFENNMTEEKDRKSKRKERD
ncbi:EF-hand domain-containing protein [Lacinutrix sp. C3R15]|uniref:EF-hand domain-containing protein n=1 Tax=Flavobacteriaceae TaxID=49546 RepID=UPI001C0A31EB|nr:MULTISPECIES: EF-hand domain-containing protein [Flavobacteriaceae]MBU2938567.1 EF-hand domain-containing protein [Lacinutrix sp. C3R15]MDO6621881.1 EF-hand domain-containing protein [Oceanihabitans sp. 1_MG-2023]